MIVCAMLGTVVVSISDVKSSSETHGSLSSASGAALGNGLAFVAAFVYAFYGTSVKYTMPEESEEGLDTSSSKRGRRPLSTSLVFGYMGVLAGVFLLPLLMLLAWAGLENLHWMGARTFGLLIVKGEEQSHQSPGEFALLDETWQEVRSPLRLSKSWVHPGRLSNFVLL